MIGRETVDHCAKQEKQETKHSEKRLFSCVHEITKITKSILMNILNKLYETSFKWINHLH